MPDAAPPATTVRLDGPGPRVLDRPLSDLDVAGFDEALRVVPRWPGCPWVAIDVVGLDEAPRILVLRRVRFVRRLSLRVSQLGT